MPDWNPSFPASLGPEWLPTLAQTTRVRATVPGWMQRFPSTIAEQVDHVLLAGQFTTAERGEMWSLVEAMRPDAVAPTDPVVVDLVPNGSPEIETWRTLAGSSSSLHSQLTTPIRWPDSTVQATGIRDRTGYRNYRCSVDASDFGEGGIYQNARICRVEIAAVAAAAGGGFRTVLVQLRHNNTVSYTPGGSGSHTRIHGYGAQIIKPFGELNPHEQRPWLPSDIAGFDQGGPWTVRVRSQATSAANQATVYSLALRVTLLPEENRQAVAVWRRPDRVNSPAETVETGQFISVPGGEPGWQKPAGEDVVLWWRQARSPAHHSGRQVGSDVRWMLTEQDLGPGGQPPGPVFPLTNSGTAPAPEGVLAGDLIGYNEAGLPTKPFEARHPRAAGFALITSNDTVSPDSQPYQLSLSDLFTLTPGSPVGQQVTPSRPVALMTARTVVIPPVGGGGTLTVGVHQVSDGQRVGGVLAINASDIRRLRAGAGGLRYIEGHLSSAAILEQDRQYEVRLSVSGGAWLVFVPQAPSGPEASFGGIVDGAVIDGVPDVSRTLLVNVQAQPDPPRDLTTKVVAVPTRSQACSAGAHVEHVETSWQLPATPLGQSFEQYELERQLLRTVAGTDCEPRQPTMLTVPEGGDAHTPAAEPMRVGQRVLQTRIETTPSSWEPGQDMHLVGQEDAWGFGLTTDGRLTFSFDSDDGAGTRTSTEPVPSQARHVQVTFDPNDRSALPPAETGFDADAQMSTIASTEHVAPTVTAENVGDLLLCGWLAPSATGTYTPPAEMLADTTVGAGSTMLTGAELLDQPGPTGDRTALFSESTFWGGASVTARAVGGALAVEERHSGSATAVSGWNIPPVEFTTGPVEAGWWMLAIQGAHSSSFTMIDTPTGGGWQPLANSGLAVFSGSQTIVWAKQVETSGPQTVGFRAFGQDQHVNLLVLSHVQSDASDTTVFEASLDGFTWEPVGDPVTVPSGGVAVPASDEPLTVGGPGFGGDVRSVRVRVAGVTVADPDFTDGDPGDSELEDTAGNIWVIQPPAVLAEDTDAAPVTPADTECEWVPVATIRDQATRRFVDHEVPRGDSVRYRVRQTASTGAGSDWVESGFVTPRAQGAEVVFTSNLRPDLELVYDREPEQQIRFLSHDATEIVPLHGGDLQVVFMEPEDRGRSVAFEVTVNFGTQPTSATPGVAEGGASVFRPLDDLTRHIGLPYICVMDHDGNRWLGHVGLSNAVYEQPGHRYHLPVTVTPTHLHPIPVETEPADDN